MAARRWYPSVAALGNGEAVIIGGGPAAAEVYQTNGALRRLTGFSGYAIASTRSWCRGRTARSSSSARTTG